MTKPTENELFEQWLKNNYPDCPPPISEIWQARAELADKEKAELQAQINELREALEKIALITHETKTVLIISQALANTASPCLIEHDNELIERCAKVADAWEDISCRHKIRALKG